MTRQTPAQWPALALDEWQPTRETLHLWTQIVGKVRLANTPLTNHWWNTPLYVSARGLTTSPMPLGSGLFQIDFDFVDHQLRVLTSDGRQVEVGLYPRSVADLHAELLAALSALGANADIWSMPVEIADVIPFDQDDVHASYDPDHVGRFWQQLIAIHRVLTEFRTRFVGKVSPVHYFWGAPDIAVTRFSGREAPPHPGGAPNVGRWVMQEAYSHEVSSCGFFPGGTGEGVFYSYAYPEPPGFAAAQVAPGAWSGEMGEFVLPYTDVRTADDPEGLLLDFLQSTYAAAADLGSWDRAHLERGD